MATHSSVLAWRIPGTEEPGGLPSTGLHRVGHDWSNLAFMHALDKGMATHSSVLAWRIPGMEGPGWLPSMGCTESDTIEAISSSSHCLGVDLVGCSSWLCSKNTYPEVQDLKEMWVPSPGWKIPWRRKWQPTPVLPWEPMDKGACWAMVHEVTKGRKRLSTAQGKLGLKYSPCWLPYLE